MNAVAEVIFTSSDGEKGNTAYAWNFHNGTNLMTYKDGGYCAPKGLGLLGSEYVISVEKNKPLLKVWTVNSQLPVNHRLLCPGVVTTIAINPDNCHIAVAVREKLHIYSVNTGELLGSGVCHFQPLQVLKWSSRGNIIACGGEDGMVTVWLLSTLVIESVDSEPQYTFSDHTLPVSDMYITPESMRAHLITVSFDRTCKIYTLLNGNLILTLVFDTVLTAVYFNTQEIFLGTNTGGILQFCLDSAPMTGEYHANTEEKTPAFVGHTKCITCLSYSIQGKLLLSGSADETAKIWDVGSKQCLKTIAHKGVVTNAFFSVAPKQMFNHELKPSFYFSTFKTDESSDTESFSAFITNSDLIQINNVLSDGIHCETSLDSQNEELKSLKEKVNMLNRNKKKIYKSKIKQLLEKDRCAE